MKIYLRLRKRDFIQYPYLKKFFKEEYKKFFKRKGVENDKVIGCYRDVR